MPTYSFQMSARVAGSTVSVTPAGSSTVVASGTLDANSLFTASLPVGDYVATAAGGHYSYKSAGTVAQSDPDQMVDLSSTYATALPPSSGTDDTAVINAALAAGGNVRGRHGETYIISAHLVIGSDTTLDMRGCTIQWKSGVSGLNLLRNVAAAPQRSVADAAITAASTTLTSASAAFTAADVGRVVNVAGAGGEAGRPTTLSTTVASVANATTVVLADAAKTTVSGAAAKIHNRDSGIRIIGGTWDRNGATGASTAELHGLYLHHVTDIVIDIEGYTALTVGAKYAISLADAHRFSVRVEKFNTVSDGVHVTGPASEGAIPYLAGHTGDDLVGLTGADYPGYGDTAGDITDIHIGTLLPDNCRGIYKILPGAGNRIDRIRGEFCAGTGDGAGAFVGEDVNYPDTRGGIVGTVDLGSMNARVAGELIKIVGVNTEKLIARIGGTSGVGNLCKVIQNDATAFTITDLILDDCVAGTGQTICTMSASAATLKNLRVRRAKTTGSALVINGSAGAVSTMQATDCDITYTAGNSPFYCSGGTIAHLSLGDCLVDVSGSTNAKKAMILGAGVSKISVLRGKVTGSGTLGCLGYNPAPAALTVVLDGCELSGMQRAVDGCTGGLTAYLRQPVVNCSSEMFHVTTNGGTVIGEVASIAGSNSRIFSSTSTGTRRINGLSLPNDVSLLTPTAGDVAKNSNAALACGAGPVVSNGTLWKHLYTGITT